MSSTNGDRHDDSSPWTRVTRRRKKPGRVDEILRLPVGGPPDNFRPNRSPQLSAQDVRADHDKFASRWRATECCKRLCAMVRDNADSHVSITRAVCLGIGPFDPDDGSWSAQRRSHIQLAAFLAIVERLEGGTGQEIECFHQEPRFAPPDKEFLASTRGKVVDCPAATDLVDQGTLAFGIHLYRDIWAATMLKSSPGMFVGTGWDIWEGNPGAEKSPDFERIREMHALYDQFPFPQDDYSSFSSTCIYWKRNGSAG